MKRFFNKEILITGFAVFAMFFGAGNSVFPLEIGRDTGIYNIYAIAGLLLTAVIMPFIGLISMIFFDGDYKAFFYRIGKIPGFIVIVTVLFIIGPFSAMPRCITLSHAALKLYFPGLSLFVFSLISALLIFVLTVRESKLLDILGYYLSPILIVSLAVVIIKTLLSGSTAGLGRLDITNLFAYGFIEGYKTMDLFAAIFFASVVLGILRKTLVIKTSKDTHSLELKTFRVSCVAAVLLGAAYIGMSYAAAFQGNVLLGVPAEELLVTIAYNVMGSAFGVFASAIVALACLTTAITLAVLFAEFMRSELFNNKINYLTSLVITLIVTTYYANLGFGKIVEYAGPFLEIAYPSIIVLALVNIAYKAFNFKYVMIPVYLTFVLSLGYKLLPYFN